MKYLIEVFWAVPIVVLVGALLTLAITYPEEIAPAMFGFALLGVAFWCGAAICRLIDKWIP